MTVQPNCLTKRDLCLFNVQLLLARRHRGYQRYTQFVQGGRMVADRSLLIAPTTAEAELVVCHDGLSFWGGVDPETGLVIDAHHSLNGICLAGKIVMMPTSLSLIHI